MRKIVFILFLIPLLSFAYRYSYGQADNLKSATIKWVNFDIETIADVSCDAFDSTFNDVEKKIKFIFNPTDLQQFQLLYKEFKPVKQLQSFDTRGSIHFINGKPGDTYCFDRFGHFYKNGKYYVNKGLIIFISDKIFKQHPHYLDTLRYHE